jgi:hypothetical protein
MAHAGQSMPAWFRHHGEKIMPTIEWIAVDALKPNTRNARTHSRKQIRQIADSIAAFGFAS